MTTGLFPSDPGSRKVILVLHQHDVEKCLYEPGAAQLLLDDEAYVLQSPILPQTPIPAALQKILDAGLARPGSVLVQSPYDPDDYADLLLALQRYALAKQTYFSMFCMHLGAKEVTVEQIDLRTRSSTMTLRTQAGGLGRNAQLAIESEELAKFRNQMNLHDEFAGSPPDVTAAEGLLRRTGLWADPSMRTLLEMRRGGANPLATRKLVLSLSSEVKGYLSVVGRLTIPPFIKLSAEYGRVVREEYEYTSTVLVRF
jgi:hypothetical protein